MNPVVNILDFNTDNLCAICSEVLIVEVAICILAVFATSVMVDILVDEIIGIVLVTVVEVAICILAVFATSVMVDILVDEIIGIVLVTVVEVAICILAVFVTPMLGVVVAAIIVVV